MKPDDFQSERAGLPIKAIGGYWAFVPAPLPPKFEYDPTLTHLLSQADAALGELSGVGRYLPNPNLLIAPYVKREAVASSRIEGIRADLADLMLDEIEPRWTPPGSDVPEVRNYVAALNHGIRQLDTLPLSGRLIRNLHAILMRGVRGEYATPGEFRRSQNWIGRPGCTLEDATYVPPPHDPQMHECLKHWENFMNQRGQMPELIQCALIHEHFEAIHPFIDGNGRIGRLLIPLFLIERGRLSAPLLYVSHTIEQTREEYYTLLQRIRTHGEWESWLHYFLRTVRDTAHNALEQSRAVLRLRDELRVRLVKRHRELTLLDHLFVNPYTTVAHSADRLGVTPPTATKSIRCLEAAGILEEASGRDWGRYWVARVILDTFRGLDNPSHPPAVHGADTSVRAD
jgi:Fic family protein